MEVQLLHDQLISLHWELLRAEVLDHQYKTVRELETIPGSLTSSMKEYMNCSKGLILEALKQLRAEDVDFERVHELMFRVKGAASCFGAPRIVRACHELQDYCFTEPNKDRALQLLKQIQKEHYLLDIKLQPLFELERQIINVCGRVPKWW